MSTRPNVILFIAHDTGRFISPYGIDTVHTPACERLAGESVRFTSAHSTAPLCCPARASCVTGRYPHQNGVMGLTADPVGGFALHSDEVHAAAHFKSAGYETMLCGFEHEAKRWQPLGFDRAISGPGGPYNGGGDLREHAGEIDRWLEKRDASQPFYMQIGCHETHVAWDLFDVEPDDSRGVSVPAYLKDTPEVRQGIAAFQGAVSRMDQGLGGILDVLEHRGIRQDTIFVFTTDHGIDFPRAKGTLYDAGTGVFLFMSYPNGDWNEGQVCDQLVSHIDILPTLLEACGLDAPTKITGASLLPILSGDNSPVRDAVFTEKTYHDLYDPSRAVRTRWFAYLRHFEVNIFQDIRLGTLHRRNEMSTDGQRCSVEELFDLEADPNELNNLADDPAYGEALADMRRRLLEWMRESDDPLLQGPVPSPSYQQRLREFTST